MKSTPETLSQLFQRHKLRSPERPTSPTKDELLETLVRVLDICPTTFIIIDALDESNEVGLLLETLCTLFKRLNSNCRILVTSRAEHEIQSVLEKQSVEILQIQRNHVDHDVALHVRAVLETDDRLRAHRQGMKDLIITALTEGAQGMYDFPVLIWCASLTFTGSAGFNARLIISKHFEQPMRSRTH